MSHDLAAIYREAIRRRQEAAAQIRAYRELINAVGHNLHCFDEPRFARDIEIDTTAWPTGQQIADSVDAWLRAHADATAAWDQIPKNERHGLTPPDHP